MKAKNAIVWLWHNVPEVIAGTALIVAISITSVNVIARYLFGFSIPGCDEIISFGFTWTVFPGAAAAYKRKMCFGIDAVVEHLPYKVKDALDIFVRFFLLALTAFVTYLSFLLANNAWIRKTPVLFMPYFYLDFSLVVGFAFMTWYSFLFVLQIFQRKPAIGGGPVREVK